MEENKNMEDLSENITFNLHYAYGGAPTIIFQNRFLAKKILAGKTVFNCRIDYSDYGSVNKETVKNFESIISNHGLKLIIKNYRTEKDKNIESKGFDKVFESKDALVLFYNNIYDNENKCSFDITTVYDEKLKEIYDDLIKLFSNKSQEESPNLYVVQQSDNGLKLDSIGRPATAFIKDNYSANVIDDFNYVTKQLDNSNPDGRLTIIHGVPGSGKTYFLRGIMDCCNNVNTKVVFFQPSLFQTLNAIDLLSLFIKSQGNHDNLILFIEDGDDCLVPRGMDNMNVITNMLNIADGLIGNILNIKIVITTNAKKVEIEPALKRPGRLCRIIEIDSLSPKHARSVYERLTGKDIEIKNKMTLAEVYSLAKNETITKENIKYNG